MLRAVFWSLVVAPAVPFIALSISYRRIVDQKTREVTGRLKAFEAEYDIAYGVTGADRDLTRELQEFYDWRTYYVPVLVTSVLSCAIAFTALLYLEVPLGLDQLAKEASRLSSTLLVAAGGAYLWGIYDLLQRHRSADISSTALHLTWHRIAVAAAAGAAIGVSIKPPMDIFVALAIAGLPIEAIKEWIQERANVQVRAVQSSPDQLRLIKGMTPRLRDRLADEDIESVEALAFTDPVRLLFRTNIEWNVILDLVDQATLIHYVGERVDRLSPKATGAIDLASLYLRLTEGTPEESQTAHAVIGDIATALGESEAAVTHLAYLLANDPLVQFAWAHWDAARPWKDAENESADSNDTLPQSKA